MIHVVYDRALLRVSMEVHAGYGEKGSDPVCAAASILAYTLYCNAVTMTHGGKIQRLPALELASGKTEIRAVANEKYRAVVTIIFDSVCAGFALLSRDFPENVSYRVIE